MPPRLSYKKWATKECEFLRANYRKMSNPDLAKLMDRPWQSLAARAQILGISSKRERRWTSEEDAVIVGEYAVTTTASLSNKMNRTKDAILKRAINLGVKKTPQAIYDAQCEAKSVVSFDPSSVTTHDLAYLAGIVDGEGCIYAEAKRSRSSIRLTVTNTSLALINWIVGRFGGNVHVCKKSRRRKRICYSWYVNGQRLAARILAAIIPYMVIKRKQAELALQWQPGMSAEASAAMVEAMSALNSPENRDE